ncbi:MAG: T9SS type A sorting domain-containing protein, partial [Bacteroidota bacterium]|nr:T9SS type A sorting domain-containing protein [Bacteroidota bacterium]
TALDNSLAGSWEASSDIITSAWNPSVAEFTVFPNPVTDILNIRSETDISSICIYDTKGTILLTQEGSGPDAAVDMSSLKPGIYIIRIFTLEGSFPRMAVKQ